MFGQIAFSLIILFTAGFVAWGVRVRPAADAGDFEHRKHRRRTEVCILLFILALAIFAGVWAGKSIAAAVYWLTLLALSIRLLWLARQDWREYKQHAQQILETSYQQERELLEQEIEQYRS